jgi:serine/threonine-protein kinase HipA
MIKVWSDGAQAGLLDRTAERGSAFVYLPETARERAVSLTMPVRLPSYDTPVGLAPIFDMNLPEGALREYLRLAFAKALGTFDDFGILTIVGRSQVGRIRYTGAKEPLNEDVPFQSVDEILASHRDGTFYSDLVERFAEYSGISGIQPKVLVRDETSSAKLSGERMPPNFRGATHIIKLWDRNEYPELAANEYFCLTVAKRCGLEVPPFRLATDGSALVIDRFDLRPDGSYLGFEDFCVLNAQQTADKYLGSYESSILRRFRQFSHGLDATSDLEKLFTLITLNCVLRNGDAHLKNFGVIYNDIFEEPRLAPVFDLVTTATYRPRDNMALTLNGTKNWPDAKALRRVGETRIGPPAKISEIFDRVSDAVAQTIGDAKEYIRAHQEFGEIGERMIKEWEKGRLLSLHTAKADKNK